MKIDNLHHYMIIAILIGLLFYSSAMFIIHILTPPRELPSWAMEDIAEYDYQMFSSEIEPHVITIANTTIMRRCFSDGIKMECIR